MNTCIEKLYWCRQSYDFQFNFKYICTQVCFPKSIKIALAWRVNAIIAQLNFLKNKQMQVNKLEIEQNYPLLILYSWNILLDLNLFPKQSKSAIQHKPTQSHTQPQRDQWGIWQLIGSYVFFINQSQYSILWDICILFPCLASKISSFLHCLLKTALLSANQIQ